MYYFRKTNCASREHCKNKDSFVCVNCIRNQSQRFDNYEYETKPLKFNITCNSTK